MIPVPPLRTVTTREKLVDLGAFPDFLIAGPQRTGTTWIYRNLMAHPHLFLPPKKEIYYFSTLGKPGHPRFQFEHLEDYLAIFREGPKARIKKCYDTVRRCGVWYAPRLIGESTASYATLSANVIADIAALNPKIKVVLMLRDPVERIWSHAKKEIVRDLPPGEVASTDDFRKFFSQRGQRERSAMRGVVDRWRAVLPFEQVYLGDYEQLCNEPRTFLEDLCRFVGAPLPKRFGSPHLRSRINATAQKKLAPGLEAELRMELAPAIDDMRELLTDFDARWRQPLRTGG